LGAFFCPPFSGQKNQAFRSKSSESAFGAFLWAFRCNPLRGGSPRGINFHPQLITRPAFQAAAYRRRAGLGLPRIFAAQKSDLVPGTFLCFTE
jgi:hypothetical protein